MVGNHRDIVRHRSPDEFAICDGERREFADPRGDRDKNDRRAGEREGRHHPLHESGGYPPRAVYGFYSKDTLQYRVGFQRREKLDLLKVRPDPNIAGRLYQIETITRVTERFRLKGWVYR